MESTKQQETPLPTPSPQSQLPTAIPTPKAPTCEANKWSIVPWKILSFPSENVGFKYIIVPFVIKNSSQYWGTITEAAGLQVLTEGGFTYQYGGSVKTKDLFPYEAYLTNHDEYVEQRELFSNVPTFSNLATTTFPPGFVYRGGILQFFSHANSWPQAVFQVAESQSHFTMTISSLAIVCIHPSGQLVMERFGPVVIDLDKDIQQLPRTKLPDIPHLNFATPINIPDKGSLQLLEVRRHETVAGEKNCDNSCVIRLNFRFTNASAGYQTVATVNNLYLLGDDGLLRPQYGGGIAQAGPGQSVEMAIPFFEGPETDHLMLAWQDQPSRKMIIYDIPNKGEEIAPISTTQPILANPTHPTLSVGTKLKYNQTLISQPGNLTVTTIITQKIKGEENIGRFHTWVIETERSNFPTSSETEWVDQSTGIIIKSTSIIRNMPYAPGGVVTSTYESTFDLNTKIGMKSSTTSDPNGNVINKLPSSINSTYSVFMLTENTEIGMYYPSSEYSAGLQVISSEQIEVPAGKFDCWVLTNPSNKSLGPMYFDKQTGILVRTIFYVSNNNATSVLGSSDLTSYEN